jgi:hypothetical protein
MTVIAVIPARETRFEMADSVSRFDGQHAPYGYAGFLVQDATIVCPDCIRDDEVDDAHAIFGDVETDFPGMFCEGCDRQLDTRLLVYESGPGSELDLEEFDAYRID